MRFPWEKYDELPIERRNTLQVFITGRCNLRCDGCFARKELGEKDMGLGEYFEAIDDFVKKGGKQVNLLGGEPLLHPKLPAFLEVNRIRGLKTTIYTNGYFLGKFSKKELEGSKVRVSLYCKTGNAKSTDSLPKSNIPFEVCYMVSSKTSIDELLDSADCFEKDHHGKVFFISSIREMDNERKEFFDDTEMTMPPMKYKELVHQFLERYSGKMEIHVSKRGVFESTQTLPDNKCRFANYFSGKKIVQCPYDIINQRFQPDYSFNKRYCKQNNTCLMSKIVLKRKSP